MPPKEHLRSEEFWYVLLPFNSTYWKLCLVLFKADVLTDAPTGNEDNKSIRETVTTKTRDMNFLCFSKNFKGFHHLKKNYIKNTVALGEGIECDSIGINGMIMHPG